MNFLKLTPGLLAVCVLTFNGCKKDSETTGETTLSYEFQAENTASIFSSASEKTLVYLTVPGIRWTTATLNLSKLRFSAMREGKPFESSLANIENINLLEAGKYFGSISLPKGWYNDVQVTLTLKKSATAAIPLTLKATLTTETGSVVPVEFYFNDDAELNILADRLNASGDKYIGQIRLKLSTLVSQVNFSALASAQRTNGVVVISSTSNTSLYNIAKLALTNSYTININRK